MAQFEITFVGDAHIHNVHHLSVEFNGNSYSVIFGNYVNGSFCCIPTWEAGCELSWDLKDTYWNASAIGEALKNKAIGQVIAEAICIYAEVLEAQNGDQK